jgi:hypothetical protein
MGQPVIFLTVSLETKEDLLQRIKSNFGSVRIRLENDLKMTIEDTSSEMEKVPS